MINENMPSSGAPPGFPDCHLSLKQWDCPRSSLEHALRLVRKTLLKGRGLLETVQLHGALLCCCWDRCAKARPGSRRVGLLTDMPVQGGWGSPGTDY
jgi:hypothetical protein